MPPSPQVIAAPPDIALQLPPAALLDSVLPHSLLTIPPGVPLCRAAWSPESIWPETAREPYRFGPPPELLLEGRWPFHWVYLAEQPITAAWEAQLCRNPVTEPGRFVIAPAAQRQAVLATMRFAQPLVLFDLSGETASKLGIYDQLRSPDYRWCQWMGWQLDQLIVRNAGTIQGICYPSRKHPGAKAYAISSRAQAGLAPYLSYTSERFADSALYAQLREHPCHLDDSQL